MATGVRGAIVFTAAMLVGGCSAKQSEHREQQPAHSSPFNIEEVDFTRDCGPNAAFDRLLTVLLPQAGTESDDAQPAFDESLYNAASGYTSHVLHFNAAKDWHGLHLAEIRLLFGVESGPANYSLAFADRPERVREVWNARDWDLPPIGETRLL